MRQMLKGILLHSSDHKVVKKKDIDNEEMFYAADLIERITTIKVEETSTYRLIGLVPIKGIDYNFYQYDDAILFTDDIDTIANAFGIRKDMLEAMLLEKEIKEDV